MVSTTRDMAMSQGFRRHPRGGSTSASGSSVTNPRSHCSLHSGLRCVVSPQARDQRCHHALDLAVIPSEMVASVATDLELRLTVEYVGGGLRCRTNVAHGAHPVSDEEIPIWTQPPGLEFPRRTSPINFAIQRPDGLTSDAWGVRTEKKSEAYIYGRDFMKGAKISLHASGECHIKVAEDSRLQVHGEVSGERLRRWQQPELDEHAIASFSLVVPPWGIGLDAEERAEARSTWDKNHILIGGHEEELTVVSFVIVDESTTPVDRTGSWPTVTLGLLPLPKVGKNLWVAARRYPGGDLQEKVENQLKYGTNARMLAGRKVGDVFPAFVTGDKEGDSPWLVVVRAEIKQE